MKNLIILLFIFFSGKAFSQDEYTLKIDDKTIEVSLNKTYEININGKKVNVSITGKDTLTYSDDLFSFKYPKDYKVSKLVVEEGLEQITILSAEGSGIIIQKYSTMNPTKLNEMMLGEMTKESLDYGYVMERQNYQKTLSSGQKIKVDKAVLKYKDETNTYEVASIGKKDQGIVVLTVITNKKYTELGKKIIDLMWDSLIYK